jgi:beta-glucanase (GH16 family)
MKITVAVLFLLLTVGNGVAQTFIDPATTAGIAPANINIGTGWELNFSDEFNGTSVNTTKWNIDNSTTSRAPRPGIGISSWFWKPANVAVANGNLILKVSKETSSKMHCGSINSKDKYMTTFGYFEARIKIADATKGTHTAFWLQGPNMGNVDGTGNDGAEIDIFESAWTGDFTKSVIHIDGYGTSHQASTKQFNTPGIHSGYHTWGMWWTSDFIKIYYDGVLKVTYDVKKWIPQVDEFLWLSDGASFGFPDGDPCFTSQPIGFLTEAYVDYIRVWKPQITSDIEIPDSSGIEIKTVNNKLQIDAQSLINSVSIYDTLGRNVHSNFPATTSTTIDLQNSGVYIVEAQIDEGKLIRRKIALQ